VYGADQAAAEAAVGELLRRVGIPLVSMDGPVIAMPDTLAVRNAAVYVEFVPQLAASVRAGDFYTPTQVSEFIGALYQQPKALSSGDLLSILSGWGKGGDFPSEVRAAGAAVRALAAQRGILLYTEADPNEVRLDLLQAVILLAHLTGDAVPLISGRTGATFQPASWRPETSGNRVLQSGACDEYAEQLAWSIDNDPIKVEVYKRVIKGAIKDAGRRAGRNVDNVVDSISPAIDAINMILLLGGIRIFVTSDTPVVKYHTNGSHENAHAEFRAHVYYESPISKQAAKCYSLAGVKFLDSGPVRDLLVRWAIDQELDIWNWSGKHLAGFPGYSATNTGVTGRVGGGCTSCSRPTDANGDSFLKVYTRTEHTKGSGILFSDEVSVKAWLDKAEFPFSEKDLIFLRIPGVDDVNRLAVRKVYDLVRQAYERVSLPSAQTQLIVRYHATDIYTARSGRPFFAFYASVPMTVDIYSCTGLAGPWSGHFIFGVEKGPLQQLLEASKDLVDLPWETIPDPGTYREVHPVSFSIDPAAKGNYLEFVRDLGFDGWMATKTPDPHVLQHYDGVVGRLEVTMRGRSFAELGVFTPGATPWLVPIEGVDEDDRCPEAETSFERH
jgi:hypothetical protein